MERLETAHYRIGDLIIRVQSDLPFSLSCVNMEEFSTPQAPADYTYRFVKISDIPAFTGEVKVVGQNLFGYEMVNQQGQYFRGFWWKQNYYDTVLRLDEREGTIAYLSNDIMIERAQGGSTFLNYFGLEYLFLRHGGLVLHSSHVNVGGRALLFSAPSGTGKSTQAALWETHAGAQVMNGDRTLLRKKDGVWTAYGCPMCGTSDIHKQGDEPVHAIVMLEQGTENNVRRLKANEAFSLLYPQITVPKWNRELVLSAMEWMDDLIAHVPVYHFSCTKEAEAVAALRSAIDL